MSNEAKASWIFGAVIVGFLMYIVIQGPDSMSVFKQNIVGFLMAITAGLFGLFFTGALLVHSQLPIPGKWTVRGGAGFGLFVIVLFWWHIAVGETIHSGEQRQTDLKAEAPQLRSPTDSPSESKAELEKQAQDLNRKMGAETESSAKEPAKAETPESKPPSKPPAGSVLKKATVTFVTDDDDKEYDTRASVDVYVPPVDLSGGISFIAFRVAHNDNIAPGVRFAEHGTYGPFNLIVEDKIPPDEVTRLVTRIEITPHGHDTWKSRAIVELTFSDGSKQQQSLQFTLSQDDRKQEWYWSGRPVQQP